MVEQPLAEQKGHTMMYTYIYMHPLTNVPMKCQPSTPYGIQEIAQIRQGQRSNQGQRMMLHIYNPNNITTNCQFSTPYGFQDIAQN